MRRRSRALLVVACLATGCGGQSSERVSPIPSTTSLADASAVSDQTVTPGVSVITGDSSVAVSQDPVPVDAVSTVESGSMGMGADADPTATVAMLQPADAYPALRAGHPVADDGLWNADYQLSGSASGSSGLLSSDVALPQRVRSTFNAETGRVHYFGRNGDGSGAGFDLQILEGYQLGGVWIIIPETRRHGTLTYSFPFDGALPWLETPAGAISSTGVFNDRFTVILETLEEDSWRVVLEPTMGREDPTGISRVDVVLTIPEWDQRPWSVIDLDVAVQTADGDLSADIRLTRVEE